MKRVLLALAALALAAPPATAQDSPVDSVRERNSAVPFPVMLSVPGHMERHAITGMGIRTKTFLKVKVYAFGLYVDADAARESLAEFAGKSAKDLEKDDMFYLRLLEMNFPMTLRLVMTRDVGGEDMAEAFDGALRPRVQKAAAEKGMPGGEAALDQFREFFNVDELTNESELVFTCADGTLMTSVRSEVKPPIASPALCWALFDVYIGEKPISGGGKKSVVRGFPELLGTM
jgi:hypothetical protein